MATEPSPDAVAPSPNAIPAVDADDFSPIATATLPAAVDIFPTAMPPFVEVSAVAPLPIATELDAPRAAALYPNAKFLAPVAMALYPTATPPSAEICVLYPTATAYDASA